MYMYMLMVTLPSYNARMARPPSRQLLPIREPDAIACNARLRTREGYCTQKPGWGTDHVGVGRCKLHGGASPKYEQTALVQAYRTLGTGAPANIRKRAEDFLTDRNIHELDREIAILRATAEAIDLRMKEEATRDFDAIEGLVNISNTIGKLVARREEVLRGRKYLIPVSTVVQWAEGIRDILQRHIEDPALLAIIAGEIAALQRKNEDFP